MFLKLNNDCVTFLLSTLLVSVELSDGFSMRKPKGDNVALDIDILVSGLIAH